MALKELIASFAICTKSRIEVIFVYTWPASICLLIASRGLPSPLEALKLILAVTFVGYSIYFYNDIRDLKDDLKSRELGNPTPANRPLGSGKISKSKLEKFTVFSAIFGVLVAFAINIKVFILQLMYIILGILYSTGPIRLKKRFLLKQITIAAGSIIAHLSGGLTLGVINAPILYLTAVSASLIIGGNPMMDLRDIRGDRVIGVKSLPVVWGPEMTVRLALGTLAAIGAASVIGYSRLGFNVAMPILVSIIIATLIYVLFPLLKRWNDPVYLNSVIFKKLFPLTLALQFTAFLGVLPLSVF